MIDIIGWIKSLLTFQPITSITVLGLIYLYLQYLIFGLLFILPFSQIKRKKKKLPDIKDIFVFVPIEDIIFRWAPLKINPQAAIYAHIIWALIHGFPSVIFVIFHGLLMLRLWLGGLWLEAIFIHLFHDILWIIIARRGINTDI